MGILVGISALDFWLLCPLAPLLYRSARLSISCRAGLKDVVVVQQKESNASQANADKRH